VSREKLDLEDFLVCQVYLDLMAPQVSRVIAVIRVTLDLQEWAWRGLLVPQVCQDLQAHQESENRASREAEARRENQESAECLAVPVLLVLQVTASSVMLWLHRQTAKEPKRGLKQSAALQNVCINSSFIRESNPIPYTKKFFKLLKYYYWNFCSLTTKAFLKFISCHLAVKNFTIIFSSYAAILSNAALKSNTAFLLIRSSSQFHFYFSIAHKEL